MSKFRIELDISFNEENDAIAFLNLIEEIKNRIFIGTGNEQIAIIKKCRFHECFHDEIPPLPCEDYTEVDFSIDKVDHKNSQDVKIEPETLLS
jgi:hypothetical protein